MSDGDVGRLLVASLHQSLGEVLPSRVEFYDPWLNPVAYRDGRIGLAPVAAALSFLRREGDPYRQVVTKAGVYTADWLLADLPAVRGRLIRAVPQPFRLRLALPVIRRLVQHTYTGSRARVRVSRGTGTVTIETSIFCEVRERSAHPLCDYYASAIARMMELFGLDVEVHTDHCHASGGGTCRMSVQTRG